MCCAVCRKSLRLLVMWRVAVRWNLEMRGRERERKEQLYPLRRYVHALLQSHLLTTSCARDVLYIFPSL